MHIALASLALAEMACRDGASAAADVPSAHAACDRALAQAPSGPVPVRLADPHVISRTMVDERVGDIADVAWSQRANRYLVFDRSNREVLLLDSVGNVSRTYGDGRNGGPTFTTGPKMRFEGNRLHLFGDSLFALTDVRAVQLIDTAGRLVREIRIEGAESEAYNTDLHTTTARDGVLLVGLSGKFASVPPPERVKTRIYGIPLARPAQPRLLMTAENSWALLPPFEDFPAHQPYRDEHRRTWDARDSVLVVYPWHAYGACFVDPGSARVIGAHRLTAPRLVVDSAERSRVLRRAFGTDTTALPFLGVTGAALYKDKWPDHGPYYTDAIMASPDEAWLLRRVDATRVVVDIYRTDQGYIGSFEPPGRVLPKMVTAGQAVVMQTDNDRQIVLRYAVPVPSGLSPAR
jgi:hypothetical protein